MISAAEVTLKHKNILIGYGTEATCLVVCNCEIEIGTEV